MLLYAAISRDSVGSLAILLGEKHSLNYGIYFIPSLYNILMSFPKCSCSTVSVSAGFATGHPHLKLGPINPLKGQQHSLWSRWGRNTSSFTQLSGKKLLRAITFIECLLYAHHHTESSTCMILFILY